MSNCRLFGLSSGNFQLLLFMVIWFYCNKRREESCQCIFAKVDMFVDPEILLVIFAVIT